MTKTTTFYKTTTCSAGDAANGYKILQWSTGTGRKIRLLCISASNDNTICRVRLFVNFYGSANDSAISLYDEVASVGHFNIWSGSMILDNVNAFGATFLNPTSGDQVKLRMIWEELT